MSSNLQDQLISDLIDAFAAYASALEAHAKALTEIHILAMDSDLYTTKGHPQGDRLRDLLWASGKTAIDVINSGDRLEGVKNSITRFAVKNGLPIN
jgi:hypothetical protein